MTKRITTTVCAALALAAAGSAKAGDFDGSKPLLCAPTDIMSCHGAGDCGRMSGEEANLPAFLHLDFEKSLATGRLSNGEQRETTFEAPKAIEGAIVIQGIARDGQRAFSFRVGSDGDLTVAMADQGGGMLIQGSCMPVPKSSGGE